MKIRPLSLAFIFSFSFVTFLNLAQAQQASVGRLFTCKATSSMKMSDRVITGKSMTIPKNYVQNQMKPEFSLIEIVSSFMRTSQLKSPLLMFGSYDLRHRNRAKNILEVITPRFAMPRGEQPGNKLNLDLNVLRPEPPSDLELFPIGQLKITSDDLSLRRSGRGVPYFGLSVSGFSGKTDDIERFLDGTGDKSLGDIFGDIEGSFGGWDATLVVPKSFASKGSTVEEFPAKLIFRNATPKAWNAVLENRVELMCVHKQNLDQGLLEAIITASTSFEKSGFVGIPELEEILGEEEGEKGTLHDSREDDPTAESFEFSNRWPPTSLSDMVPVLANPDLKLYSVDLKPLAFTSAALLLAYQIYSLGGRTRYFAYSVSGLSVPALLGRDGFRVPRHKEYNYHQVVDLAKTLDAMDSPEEQLKYVEENTTPEFMQYFWLVAEYVRNGLILNPEPECSGQCL